jgi:hypothetical protein
VHGAAGLGHRFELNRGEDPIGVANEDHVALLLAERTEKLGDHVSLRNPDEAKSGLGHQLVSLEAQVGPKPLPVWRRDAEEEGSQEAEQAFLGRPDRWPAASGGPSPRGFAQPTPESATRTAYVASCSFAPAAGVGFLSF